MSVPLILNVGVAPENSLPPHQLKATASGTPLVMLGTYEDQTHQTDAIRLGASFYLPKSRLQIELVPTLKKLLTRNHTFDTFDMEED